MMKKGGRMARRFGIAALVLMFFATTLSAQGTAVSKRQQVFFFKLMFKTKTAIGILGNKDVLKDQIQEIEQAAMSYQVWPRTENVKSEGDVGKALRNLLEKLKVEAIMLLPDAVVTSAANRKFIIQECMVKKIPVVGDSREAVEAGALYALTLQDNKVVALINLKAAAALEIQVPPEVLADAVVVVQP